MARHNPTGAVEPASLHAVLACLRVREPPAGTLGPGACVVLEAWLAPDGKRSVSARLAGAFDRHSPDPTSRAAGARLLFEGVSLESFVGSFPHY